MESLPNEQVAASPLDNFLTQLPFLRSSIARLSRELVKGVSSVFLFLLLLKLLNVSWKFSLLLKASGGSSFLEDEKWSKFCAEPPNLSNYYCELNMIYLSNEYFKFQI